MNIGIFDTGSGGRFVAEQLRRLLPFHEYTVVNDAKNAPYGEKSTKEINVLTHQAITPLLAKCSLIVIACNTATAAALESLRATHPRHAFIGFEPMIKPAAYGSKSGRITLLSTHATAISDRTHKLITKYASDIIIDIPDTSGWATAIDNGAINSLSLNEVAASVKNGSDSLIIGCTHYIALLPHLRDMFPAVTVYEPTQAVARRVVVLTAAGPHQ